MTADPSPLRQHAARIEAGRGEGAKRRTPRGIGDHQRHVLAQIVTHGGWHRGCDWNPYAIVEVVCQSLQRRGLVDARHVEGKGLVYEATPDGLARFAREVRDGG